MNAWELIIVNYGAAGDVIEITLKRADSALQARLMIL